MLDIEAEIKSEEFHGIELLVTDTPSPNNTIMENRYKDATHLII